MSFEVPWLILGDEVMECSDEERQVSVVVIDNGIR